MQTHLLQGIYQHFDLATEDQQKIFLGNLQNPVRELREAYRSYPIQVDYNVEDTQHSYLITYFHHYTDLLYHTLNTAGRDFDSDNINELLLFGSGPCPELVGFLRYLTRHRLNPRRHIKVRVMDIAADEWKYSRDIVHSWVVPMFTDTANIERTKYEMNFTEKFSEKLHFSDTPTLCVFQNCLNEMGEDHHEILVENILTVFNNLSVGSYFTIIDLPLTPIISLIQRIEAQLSERQDCQVILTSNDGIIEYNTSQAENAQVRAYLLNDPYGPNPTGLLPKRKLHHISFLLKKV